MKRSIGSVAIAVLIVLSGCAAKQRTQYRTVRIPPRIDLTQHEMIGVVEFESTNEGELGPLATRRFTESARRDQGLIRMVGLKPEAVDPERARQLGREHGVRTIVVGKLTVSNVRPSFSISRSLSSGSLSGSVEATLDVEILEAATGASLWSASAQATKSVGNLRVFSDKTVAFDAEDPERAYGVLIDALVAQVTADFQATWQRQRVY